MKYTVQDNVDSEKLQEETNDANRIMKYTGRDNVDGEKLQVDPNEAQRIMSLPKSSYYCVSNMNAPQ